MAYTKTIPPTTMGNCKSQPKLSGTTILLEKFVYPSTATHYDIPTGGFSDIWSAMSDWSNKNAGLENKLREYTKHNVCSESIIVLHYQRQTWVFHNQCPNTGVSKYRVINL